MATPTEPVAGALFRALRTTADPELARAAEEEIRQIAGQNVIAVLGAKIDSQGARIDVKFSRIEARITEVRAEIKAQGARIDAQTARIDVLQRVIRRVIWPLIVLLAAPIFGLLYKVLTG